MEEIEKIRYLYQETLQVLQLIRQKVSHHNESTETSDSMGYLGRYYQEVLIHVRDEDVLDDLREFGSDSGEGRLSELQI